MPVAGLKRHMLLLLWLGFYHAVEALERVVVAEDAKAGLPIFSARGATIVRVLPPHYSKYFLPHGNQLILAKHQLASLAHLAPISLDIVLHWRLDGGTALERVERLMVEVVPSPNLRKPRDTFEPCENVFSQKRFPLKVAADTTLGTTIRRIEAVCGRGQPYTYNLEPSANDSQPPFDVDPLTGDLFTTKRLDPGIHQFYVVARPMGTRKRSKAFVDVHIVQDSQRHHGSSRRWAAASRRKRELRAELNIRLPENAATGSLLPGADHFVTLQQDEVVKGAPVTKGHFLVHRNGSIQVVKALNYELESVHRFSVVVENIRTFGNCKSSLRFGRSERSRWWRDTRL